jgi:probable phosphoglycerate mutase
VTTILLARHGETDWNLERRWQGHTDRPLNGTGRAQAEELAAELAGRGITAVYSSDLARAHETATIVAARLGLPVTTEPGLREVDVGDWSGLLHDEIERLYPGALDRWKRHGVHGWADGETHEQLAERVVAAVVRIAAAHPGETVLLVTHGGSIRAAHSAAGGVDAAAGGRRVTAATGNCDVLELAVVDRRLVDV